MWKDLEAEEESHGPQLPQVVSPAQTPPPDSLSLGGGSPSAGSSLPRARSGAPLSRAAPGSTRPVFCCTVYTLPAAPLPGIEMGVNKISDHRFLYLVCRFRLQSVNHPFSIIPEMLFSYLAGSHLVFEIRGKQISFIPHRS